MKRVRNRKLCHKGGCVEWIMVRVVTVGGIEQQLGRSYMLTPSEYLFNRPGCAQKLWAVRRQLREYISRIVST
jgi:hypothetical protein